MNLVGITEPIKSEAFPSDDEIRAAINKTHEQGGIYSLSALHGTQYE
jgi:hypothetical protein